MKEDNLEWKKFKQEQSSLIESSGLPLDYTQKESIWIDFLMHGYIDHHKDEIGYSVDSMNKREYENFKELINKYFESGFEYFVPMALSNLKEQNVLREKYEFKKWRKEVEEVSNNVYRVTFTHELGASIEKTGHNLEEMENEILMTAFDMNREIEQRTKAHNKRR